MKSLIIYYSQTGNTKKIADNIAQGIINITGQCDVKRLKEVTAADWLEYDLVGCGSSIWSSCPNTRLIYMIKELPAEVKGKHAFFFCTHGVLPGRCVVRGVQPMLDVGLTVLGWKDWYASCCVPGHCKPWYTDGHFDDADLLDAVKFGEAMAQHSQRVNDGHTEIIPKLPSLSAWDEFYGVGHPFLFQAKPKGFGEGEVPTEEEVEPYILQWPTTMNYVSELEGVGNVEGPKASPDMMRINPDKCIHCHRCVEACWCDNIDGSTEVPTFRSHNCELCLFCEGVCPTGALEFDFRKPMSKEEADELRRTGGQPGMSTALDLAEAMGRFRRYTGLDEIGYDTPWEAVTGHPRHKIIP